MSNTYVRYPPASSGGVSSLNSLVGDLSLVAGTNITITPSGGNTLTIDASGSSGANQSLSNLTSPTAVNQDLIFNTGTPATLQTADGATSTTTRQLTIKSGTNTFGTVGSAGRSGNLVLASGDSNNRPGSVSISGGSVTGSGTFSAGDIAINGGNNAGPSGRGGNINLTPGTATSGINGIIQFLGNIGSDMIFSNGPFIKTSDNAVSGTNPIALASGDASSAGDTGSVAINSGEADGGQSGGITISSGVAKGTLGSGASGNVTMQSSQSFNDASGNLAITTGAAGTSSGTILFRTGTAIGPRGKIQLQDGSEGTSGYVLTSTDAFGSGTWKPSVLLMLAAADPGSPVQGQLYFNTTVNKIKVYNGTTWETVTSV